MAANINNIEEINKSNIEEINKKFYEQLEKLFVPVENGVKQTLPYGKPMDLKPTLSSLEYADVASLSRGNGVLHKKNENLPQRRLQYSQTIQQTKSIQQSNDNYTRSKIHRIFKEIMDNVKLANSSDISNKEKLDLDDINKKVCSGIEGLNNIKSELAGKLKDSINEQEKENFDLCSKAIVVASKYKSDLEKNKTSLDSSMEKASGAAEKSAKEDIKLLQKKEDKGMPLGI